ncbi:MAG: DNA primase [bacterium]|nr:DNA primase [bacterium]
MSTPVEKIKERLTIEEVVGSYVKLEGAGKNLKAKCPFHNEKTASFYVSPDRASYYCFGCGAKGDIFNFVEQFEGLDFMGALKLLADRAGIALVFEKTETKSEKERLYMIMEEATKFFESGLEKSEPAQEYVKKRGLTTDTVKNFRIGFVPADWRLLYFYLKENKYSDAEIEKAGLAKKADDASKGFYDRFRGRVMFPIMDSSGRAIAFSGRILVDDGKSAKYLNSPDTMLYNKSTVLYGIDKAKQDIRTKNYTIMVEGQMDLVLSHQAGIRNTVAVSGTALADTLNTKENAINNLGIVRRLSPNIILAFDSDPAGRKAAMRSAGIALSLGMDVKIADLPEGQDPADMVLNNQEEWKDVLRKAKPVVEFQIDTVMREVSAKKLDARKIPPLLREKVFPFIMSLGGAMERSHFIKMIHERTGLSEEAVRQDLRVGISQDRQTPTSNAIVNSIAAVSRLEQITRKLFGLLAYLDQGQIKNIDTEGIRASIKRIAGDERYDNLIRGIEPFKNELILEAEIYYGKSIQEKEIRAHLDELLLNLEEDIIREDLSEAMGKLSQAEKEKAEDDQKNDLMKKCQVLALRISEITKKRKL